MVSGLNDHIPFEMVVLANGLARNRRDSKYDDFEQTPSFRLDAMISKAVSISRRSPRARIFLEEAPCIDLDAALRTGTPDAVHLMWEKVPSETDEPFGEGVLSITSHDENTCGYLEYTFNKNREEMQYIRFAVAKTVNGVTGTRMRLVCPECKSAKSNIYFRHESWKCRSCHGLLYRSQYRADVEPDYELHDRLMVESRRLRRPYERVAVYDREVKKAKDKLARLGPIDDAQRSVSRPFAPITTSYYRGYPPD